MGSFQQGPLSQKDFLRRKRGLSSWLPAWVLKWVLQGKSQGDPCDPPRAMHDHDRLSGHLRIHSGRGRGLRAAVSCRKCALKSETTGPSLFAHVGKRSFCAAQQCAAHEPQHAEQLRVALRFVFAHAVAHLGLGCWHPLCGAYC